MKLPITLRPKAQLLGFFGPIVSVNFPESRRFAKTKFKPHENRF
jgi:hypothetical protein